MSLLCVTCECASIHFEFIKLTYSLSGSGIKLSLSTFFFLHNNCILFVIFKMSFTSYLFLFVVTVVLPSSPLHSTNSYLLQLNAFCGQRNVFSPYSGQEKTARCQRPCEQSLTNNKWNLISIYLEFLASQER